MKPSPVRKKDTAAFEKRLAKAGNGNYSLRLYLTGSTRRSISATRTVKALCEQYLKGRYELEVVDLYQQPEQAQVAQIIAAPTLIKELPLPLQRLIGDLSNPERVLIALNLKPKEN